MTIDLPSFTHFAPPQLAKLEPAYGELQRAHLLTTATQHTFLVRNDGPAEILTAEDVSTWRRTQRPPLRDTWTYLSTPPPPSYVAPVALRSQQKTSWRPLMQLACGTVARTALFVSADLVAGAAAESKNSTLHRAASRSSSAWPLEVVDTRGAVACSVVMAVSLGLTLLSAHKFASDTKKICSTRGEISFLLSVVGASLVTLGTFLHTFYGTQRAKIPASTTLVPKVIGYYLMTLRLPHSFCCSEIVHGNTPGRHRTYLATHLNPVAISAMVLSHVLYMEKQVPPWAHEIIFGSCVSLLVFSGALLRTDLSRISAAAVMR